MSDRTSASSSNSAGLAPQVDYRYFPEPDLVPMPLVDAAISAMPDVAEKIRAGNDKAIGPLVGAVMKATKGQADAARARDLILARPLD